MKWTEQQLEAYQAKRKTSAKPHRTTPKPMVKKTGMNKLESAYASHLEGLRKAGIIQEWQYEPMALRLAERCTYTPDFAVVYPDHIELHECKGFWRDDARVKWKTAAERFWWMKFVAVQKVKNEWVYEIYGGVN